MEREGLEDSRELQWLSLPHFPHHHMVQAMLLHDVLHHDGMYLATWTTWKTAWVSIVLKRPTANNKYETKLLVQPPVIPACLLIMSPPSCTTYSTNTLCFLDHPSFSSLGTTAGWVSTLLKSSSLTWRTLSCMSPRLLTCCFKVVSMVNG